MLVSPISILLMSPEFNGELPSVRKRRRVSCYGNKIEWFFELNYSIVGDPRKERFTQELKKCFEEEYVEVKFLGDRMIVIRKTNSEWTEAERSSVLNVLHRFEKDDNKRRKNVKFA